MQESRERERVYEMIAASVSRLLSPVQFRPEAGVERLAPVEPVAMRRFKGRKKINVISTIKGLRNVVTLRELLCLCGVYIINIYLRIRREAVIIIGDLFTVQPCAEAIEMGGFLLNYARCALAEDSRSAAIDGGIF